MTKAINWFVRLICRMIVWIFFKVSVEGKENLPEGGPYLLAGNHITYVDWAILYSQFDIPVRFIMYYKYSKWPIVKWAFKQQRAIPIGSASEGRTHLTRAFDEVSERLQSGDVVCIFPEGALTRDGELLRFRRGIDKILKRDPVPVVPFKFEGLWGTYFSWSDGPPGQKPLRKLFRQPIKLKIGKPVQNTSSKELQDKVTEL